MPYFFQGISSLSPVPTRSLSPHFRPFGPHTYTKMKVEYPPGGTSRPSACASCSRGWGLQGGRASLPKKILHFASQICIISGPFLSKFTEIYDFWWSQGGSPSFLKIIYIFGNHKCAVSVPFLSKFLRIGPIYDGGYKGEVPPRTEILYFWELNMHNFKCVFFENHKCTNFSPFSVKICIRRPYIRFARLQGGSAPCLRKFCILRVKCA